MPRPATSPRALRCTPEKRAAVRDDIDSLHETATLAAYIGDLAGELADLAGRSKLPMLAYFLNLARVEAEIRARELGGCKIDRES